MVKRVAICGAGLAGLAAGYFLQGPCSVTLFDKRGVGGGASGVAAGLLHPYVGKHVRLSKFGHEALEESRALINTVEEAMGVRLTRQGILRLPTHPWHPSEFARCIRRDGSLCLGEGGSLLISQGLRVNTPLYLQGLWNILERRGGQLRIQEIQPGPLEGFDITVLALGADLPFPLDRIKGQLLRIAWPESLPKPKMALIGRKYLCMEEDRKRCVLGSTYERQFASPLADQESCTSLLPELEVLVPGFGTALVVECKAALRGHHKHTYLPSVERLGPGCFALAGLGSRGLLYHVYLAKQLAHAVLA